ncbi:hypothetical protein HDV06_002334 [Boothiomyces sp. JEL0866]|nr:hypothetical protein HDV06_002334 [Boothiomyces sp. JEL0866]
MNSSLPTGIIAQWDEYYKRYYYFGTFKFILDTETGVSKWELSENEQEKSAASDRTVVVEACVPKPTPLPLEPKYSRPVAILPSQYGIKPPAYLSKAVPSMHSPPEYRYASPTVKPAPLIGSEMPYATRKYYNPKVVSYSVPYPQHPHAYGYRSGIGQPVPRTRMVRYQPYVQPTYVNYSTPEYSQKKYVHPSNSYIFGKEIRKPSN